MNRHRKLRIWRLAGDLISAAYQIARNLPPDERFVAGLQLRRAAWSVQNNIAEGYARETPSGWGARGTAARERDPASTFFRNLLDIWLASLAEVDSMIAKLSTMYELDPVAVAEAESLRMQITAGVFHHLRRGRR
jgi:hypothetical protein